MNDLDPDRLERRLHRSRFDDGLLDLLLGLWATALAADIALREGYVAPICAAVAVIFYRQFRPKLLARAGTVVFRESHRERQRRSQRNIVVLLSVSLVMGIVFAVSASTDLLDTETGQGRVAFGVMLGTVIAGCSLALQLPRFLVYALLLGGSVVTGSLLGSRPMMGVLLGAAGLAITLYAVWLLHRFLSAHPRPTDEAEGAREEPCA